MVGAVRTRTLKACYSFLVPIARFLLRAGISYREFEELSRVAFVRVAGDEYGLRGRPTNISRVAAMTGIPRKEVTRIREEMAKFQDLPRTELSPLGDLLHHWHTDPTYLDNNDQPLPLSVTGSAPSFEELVRKCAGDVPAGALRVELLRTGAISQLPDGRLEAVKRVAVPNAADDKLITSLSFNMYGLASTIAYNSNPKRVNEGRIERFVQSDRISASAAKQLRVLLRRRIEVFTEEIDNIFSATHSDASSESGRIGVGVYFFEDDTGL